MKGFEHTKAESTFGGSDTVYFREIVSEDQLLAFASCACINGQLRSVGAQNFHELEQDIEA